MHNPPLNPLPGGEQKGWVSENPVSRSSIEKVVSGELNTGNELLQLEEPSFKIEQLKRATFAESIARYFDKHLNQGEVYAVFSPESIGLLFLCDNKNTNIS